MSLNISRIAKLVIMMSDFSSGVSGYIKAVAIVAVNFPIDLKGNADVSCFQCPYFSRSSGICQLNKAIPAYPAKYIGQECPFWASLNSEEDNDG